MELRGRAAGHALDRIIEVVCVRDGEKRTVLGSKPHWLIVERPVHHVAIACLFQQIKRVIALRDVGREPTGRLPALVFFNGRGCFQYACTLFFMVHINLALGVRSAVSHDFIAALAKCCNQLRAIVIELGIDEHRIR